MFSDSQHFLVWLNEQKTEFLSTQGLWNTNSHQMLDRFIEVLVNTYVVEKFNQDDHAALKGAP